ncbi:MAG: ribonuclease E/G, partial [Tepidisphaerales bacterium]
MSKEMLINVSDGEECRIAIVENGRLEEIYMERASATSHVGNIYKGRVTNVEPAIQAAFVDFGQGRNGFLHISDLLPTYFGKRGEDISESVGRKLSRRDRPPIQKCLKRGDEITVQIIKEGIGSKGPTLSTYLSIPGRILVMMPGMENFGVSRKIEDEAERRRLRKILDELDPIEGVGFIIRTAGMGKTKAEIERDLKYLTRLWETIKKISETTRGPVELYTEGDLVTRTVRDVYGPDIDRIIIDSREVARRVKEFVRLTAPRSKTRVEYYDQPIPLFHAYNIEREIELIHSRHVPLPSGGSLVIDSTEAIVAIDVNSGKFREHADAETTAFKTDMEAADEIPRQLKLRDLGGVIICDFIDLRFERHRRAVEQRLFENFKKDKAKTRILRMSEFGIIEVTRQRMRPSLKRSIYTDCPHCRGHGLVKTPESMALDVMRKLTIAVYDDRVARVHLAVAPEVATYLANKRRRHIAELEEKRGVPITVAPAADLPLDDIRLELFDERDGRVYIETLGMAPEGDKAHRSASARREERNGHARRHPPRLRTVDPDDGTPFDDDIDEADDATSAKARKDRPEDHIRPLGMEPLREGAGHRGPRVVVPADPADAGAEGDAERSAGVAGVAAADEAEPAAATADAGDAVSDAAADMHAGEEAQSALAADEESTQPGEATGQPGEGTGQPGEGTGRRRRRRRRGGRGR